MVSLERAVSQKHAQNYLQEYSIKLGPGDDPNNPASEQRGVLVIKSKSKTKAKQRKGAVANWKVISRISAFLSLLHFMCVRYGLIANNSIHGDIFLVQTFHVLITAISRSTDSNLDRKYYIPRIKKSLLWKR